MRKSLHILSLILLIAVVCAGLQLGLRLPGDTRTLVEKKYAGWNGVLRGWVSSRWSCVGSFTRWLNACAADFEKAHDGVYLEFTVVDEAALTDLPSNGLRAPELVFFSPGVLRDANMLLDVEAPVRDGLPGGPAVPVAMGGYTCVRSGDGDALPLPNDVGRSFSLAAIALSGKDSTAEIDIPEPGIDLGLPASASVEEEVSLDRFIRGEIPALIVSQKELARLIALRDAGKGPNWTCANPGDYALADQLLLAGAVRHADEAADQRDALAQEFIHFLLTQECQQRLTDIGAFPTTGARIYPAFSPYAVLEEGLAGKALVCPDYFSEYPPPGAEGIVRKFRAGQLSAGEALALALTKSTD